MMTQIRCRQRARGRQSGFTMLEMMVSMTIFLLATGSMYGLVKIAGSSRTTTSQRSDLMKNMRLALLTIGRDAFNAGYGYPNSAVTLPDNKVGNILSVPSDVDTARDLLPAVIAGKEINTSSLTTTNTDQLTFIYQDPTFNPDASSVSQSLPITAPTYDTTNGLDQIVPVSGNATACRAKDIMLINGRNSATIAVVTAVTGSAVKFGNSDVLGINTPSASPTVNPMRNITVPAAMRRVVLVTFRVLNDGTLVRTLYANDSTTTVAAPSLDQPLVYGVEGLKAEYVLEDGTVTRNPIAGPDGAAGTADDLPANQAKVRQIRVTLTVRSTEKDASGKPFTITMTSTFDTRNLGYDAA